MTNKPIEYWDLFDAKTDQLVRTMRRGEMLIPCHLYHKTVEVIPTDGKGYLLTTRRAMTKAQGGGDYEFPRGSVISKEEYTAAAIRELREETGLAPLQLYKVKVVSAPGIKRMIFIAIVEDLHTATIQLQESETIGYRLVTFDQWIDLMATGMFSLAAASFYTDAVLNRIEKYCGKPDVEEAPSRKIQLKQVELFDPSAHSKRTVCEESLPLVEEKAPEFVAESPIMGSTKYDAAYENINPLDLDFSLIEESDPYDEES